MRVLMIGVDDSSVGGMLTVVNNYKKNQKFCNSTNLKYISTVINANKTKKVMYFLGKIPKICNVIMHCNIDIVHVHMAERTSVFREGFVVLLAKIMGRKTIIHMHGANIETWYNSKNMIIKKITSYIIGCANRVIILGENWRPFMQEVLRKKANKIFVLHNAVNVYEKKKADFQAKNILFYGMLIERKGINDLLHAFSKIVTDIPRDTLLVLYGDDKNNNIDKKINELGISNRVRYCGWLNDEDKESVFKKTRVHVLPSYNEGLPMTILETMSYGIPNVSTNIAAIPEVIINEKNGLLVTPGDIEGLAASIKKLLNESDFWERMSANSYNTVKEFFSVEAHVEKLLHLYEQMLELDSANM